MSATSETTAGPRVGVVVPNYNKSDYIVETLDSVFAQSVPVDLVVVDDGSTDDSADLIERLLSAGTGRLVRLENGGVSRARNLGAQELRPSVEFIIFLDSDDLLEPVAVERFVDYLDRHPHVGAVYANPTLIDGHGRVIGAEPYVNRWEPRWFGRRPIPDNEPGQSISSVYARFRLLPSGTMVRRGTFERTAGWDSSMCRPARPFHAEDKDMAIQLALLSQVHRLDEQLYRYRMLPTPHRDTMFEGLRELDRKWWHAPVIPDVRRSVRRAIRFDHRVAFLDVFAAWRVAMLGRIDVSRRTVSIDVVRSGLRLATVRFRLAWSTVLDDWGLPPAELVAGGSPADNHAAGAGPGPGPGVSTDSAW